MARIPGIIVPVWAKLGSKKREQMLLAFDIGNTNIVVGCFDKDKLLFEWRLKTDLERTVDEYSAILSSLLAQDIGRDVVFDSAIISSVVPPMTSDIVRVVKSTFKVSPLIVGPGVKTGLQIKTVDPSVVGADRVVNAVAVRALYGTPALVIDFGTATSFDVVSESGSYEGGIIAPGVKISIDALVERTAKLPRIEIAWPDSVLGKTTVRAMQSGSVIGYACMVDGLVAELEREVGKFKFIVATGGIGKLFSEHCKLIQHFEPNLTLQGLRILAEINR